MGINFNDWTKRIANRSDLTGRLTHLTKPIGLNLTGMTFDEINLKAVDNLINILTEKRINGSTTKTGYIVGQEKAVCFQDVPLYALIQNVEYEKQRRVKNTNEKLRYCGVGLSFFKPVIYEIYGGRPVLYEKTETAKSFLLTKDEWWRIVDLEYTRDKNKDLDIIDWTHEREWRIKGDMNFNFIQDSVSVILYDYACYKYFFDTCPPNILNDIHGVTTLLSVLM